MKKVLLLLVLSSCVSCTYKPRFINKNTENANSICCFTISSNIKNQQEIYHYITNGWEEYQGQKELRYQGHPGQASHKSFDLSFQPQFLVKI